MRLRREARTRTLGTPSHGKIPHFYQLHALCLKHRRAMKEAAGITPRSVWPQGELEQDKRRKIRDTQCLTGQRKGKVIISNIPRGLAESRGVGGPVAKCP